MISSTLRRTGTTPKLFAGDWRVCSTAAVRNKSGKSTATLAACSTLRLGAPFLKLIRAISDTFSKPCVINFATVRETNSAMLYSVPAMSFTGGVGDRFRQRPESSRNILSEIGGRCSSGDFVWMRHAAPGPGINWDRLELARWARRKKRGLVVSLK